VGPNKPVLEYPGGGSWYKVPPNTGSQNGGSVTNHNKPVQAVRVGSKGKQRKRVPTCINTCRLDAVTSPIQTERSTGAAAAARAATSNVTSAGSAAALGAGVFSSELVGHHVQTQ